MHSIIVSTIDMLNQNRGIAILILCCIIGLAINLLIQERKNRPLSAREQALKTFQRIWSQLDRVKPGQFLGLKESILINLISNSHFLVERQYEGICEALSVKLNEAFGLKDLSYRLNMAGLHNDTQSFHDELRMSPVERLAARLSPVVLMIKVSDCASLPKDIRDNFVTSSSDLASVLTKPAFNLFDWSKPKPVTYPELVNLQKEVFKLCKTTDHSSQQLLCDLCQSLSPRSKQFELVHKDKAAAVAANLADYSADPATFQLWLAAAAKAFLRGAEKIEKADILPLFSHLVEHRITLSPKGEANHFDVRNFIQESGAALMLQH